MAFNFNPISFVKGLFSRETQAAPIPQPTSTPTSTSGNKFSIGATPQPTSSGPLVSSSNVTGIKPAQSSAKEQPTAGGGITGATIRTAQKVGQIASSIPKNVGLANIGSLFPEGAVGSFKAGETIEPVLPLTPFSGAGPGGREPAVLPPKQEPISTSQPPTFSSQFVGPGGLIEPATPIFKPISGGREIAENPGGGFIVRQPDNRQTAFNPGTGKVEALQAATGDFGIFNPLGGGFAQNSFDPYVQTGIQGSPGGQSLLPGSLSSSFSSAGSIPLLTTEEERRRKQSVINKADFSLGNFFNDILRIPTARAETQPQPTNGPFPQSGAPLALSFGNNGPVNIPGGVPVISNQQRNLIDIATGKQPVSGFTSQFVGPGGLIEPGPITGQEFKRATTSKTVQTQIKPGDTITNVRNNIQSRTQEALGTVNSVNENLKSQITQQAQQAAFQQTIGASGGYVKVADPTSGQINVAKYNSDGSVSYVSPQEFQSANLNIDQIPDISKLGSQYSEKLNSFLSQAIDTTTGRPYTKEDFALPETPENPLNERLNKITKDIENFKGKFNVDFNIETERNKIIQEEGLSTLRSQKKVLDENIAGILGVYEKLADEIRNDPDFSSKLKSRRLQFLSDEQKRALTGFQRQLEIVGDQIKTAEDRVSSRMSDRMKTYELQFSQLKDLEAQEEKVRNAIAKARDDAQAFANSVLSNLGGSAWTELPKEAQDEIKKKLNELGAPHLLSILQAGLKTQKDKSLLLQAQSVANRTPAGVTINLPGVTPPGGIQGRYVPRGTAGLTDTQADDLNGDLQGANDAINTLLQTTNINDAEKQKRINSILIDLGTQYGSNKSAISIINQRFPGASSLLTNIQKTGTDITRDSFRTDIESEQQTIKGITKGGRNDARKRARERLNSKYANYPELLNDIASVFKDEK